MNFFHGLNVQGATSACAEIGGFLVEPTTQELEEDLETITEVSLGCFGPAHGSYST